ncbi:MAG TPA: cyanophycin synthetase, partial [Ilumatobacteraceae bacterium]|nr:cyanophycin synthetase [Ilumatobacteraceae bacterium]
LLPGLSEHGCSTGDADDFAGQLRNGTFFGDVVEHVALELSTLAGWPVTFGRTHMVEPPARYRLVVEYSAEQVMCTALESTIELVEAVLEGRDVALEPMVAALRAIGTRTEPGPSTNAVLDAARAREIPVVRRSDDGTIWQLGFGSRLRMIEGSATSRTTLIAADIADDKERTRVLLRAAGVPVPEGWVVKTFDDAVDAYRRLGGAVVVKPAGGNEGKGVTLGVQEMVQLQRAFDAASDRSPRVIVERFVHGDDHRVLLVGHRLVAAARRTAAHVVGDGVHSVAELIDQVNSDPRRGEMHERPLTRLRLSGAVLLELARAGLQPGSVPAAGQVVQLARTANLSTGGTASDVTDEVHPATRALLERASRMVGLDVCGLDVVATSLAEPPSETGLTVIEANASPGLRMHEMPSEGSPRAVGAAIVDHLFPPGDDGRIPIIAVTGTNGKTTVVRMIDHVLRGAGVCTGITTTEGAEIDGSRADVGEWTGPASALLVLSDPAVEVAVLETSRGGIIRRGLGWDWCDVAVYTNLSADHVGQDGIENEQALLRVKAVLAERLRDGGTLVLNAADAQLVGVRDLESVSARHPRVVLVAAGADGADEVAHHVAAGGIAYTLDDGAITEHRAGTTTVLLDVGDVPVTAGGLLGFDAENLLLAVAALRSMRTPASPASLQALGSFGGRENAGRTQWYELPDVTVLVDRGHNPAAISSVGAAVAPLATHRICVLGVPSDRSDDLVRAAGTAAGEHFDEVIVCEGSDTGGRARGDVAALVVDGLRASPCEQTRIVLDEATAVAAALDAAATKTGDVLVVVFTDEMTPTPAMLERRGAVWCERPRITGLPMG